MSAFGVQMSAFGVQMSAFGREVNDLRVFVIKLYLQMSAFG